MLNLLYIAWPHRIPFDVTFSLALAQHASDAGRWAAMEPNGDIAADLGRLDPQWLTTWPPAVAAVFFVLLKAGLAAGVIAGGLASLSNLAAAIGWPLLLRRLGTGSIVPAVLALLLPWSSFLAFAMTDFYSDHLVVALAPWAFMLLLAIPDPGDLHGRNAWIRTLVAALVCGILVTIKYSAFPLLIGAGVYFLTRDGRFPRLRTIVHAIAFGCLLILPGLLVYALNLALADQASAVLNKGFQFYPVGVRQIWNLFAPPMAAASGWEKLSFQFPAFRHGFAALAVVSIIPMAAALWIATQERKQRQLVRLLCVMTAAVCVFLLGLTAVYGHFGDWTADTRYYLPVYIGWWAICLLFALRARTPGWARGTLLILCAVPTIYALAAAALKPAVREAPFMLPATHLGWSAAGWSGNEIEQAIARLHGELAKQPEKPALLLGDPLLGNELGLPALPIFYFSRFPALYSSSERTVWAVLDQTDTGRFVARLRNADHRTIALTPDARHVLTIVRFSGKASRLNGAAARY